MKNFLNTRAAVLLSVWSISIILSIAAMLFSFYVVYRDRVSYHCDQDGHFYVARYKTEPAALEAVKEARRMGEKGWSDIPARILDVSQRKVYIYDICRYYGKIQKRDSK